MIVRVSKVPLKYRLKRAEWVKNNQERMRAYQRNWYDKNRDKHLKSGRECLLRLRKEMLTAYGLKCMCCGESEPKFLSLDHINGQGNAHRREVGRGHQLMRWLKQRGWPTDNYQLLCHNCNQAKGAYGSCPHTQTP